MDSRVWLKQYVPGVPDTINPDAFTSLVALFEKYANDFSTRTAFINFGVSLTYQKMKSLVDDFAAFLQNYCGLKKGERFAIMMPNILQYPVALFGALKAGLIVVNVNPLYTASELEKQLNDAGAKAIIVLETFADHLEKALPKTQIKHVVIAKIGDLLGCVKGALYDFVVRYVKGKVPDYHLSDAIFFKKAIKIGRKQPFIPVAISNEDIAFLQYTGGTTGRSKGAILTHRNMIANVLQCASWIRDMKSDSQVILVGALPMYHIFSLTETSPVVTMCPTSIMHFCGSAGVPVPSTLVEIRNEQGTVLPAHQQGEVWVSGPQVMQGYWNQTAETKSVFDENGWLRTGDIGYMDERGFLYIVDRKKDMVLVSGFNVYPNEIEDVLVSHPGVLTAAVIGVPSEKTGEALKAYIVKKDPNVSAEELKAFCRQSLTGYKVPKIFEFRDELPLSNVGKVLRRELQKEALAASVKNSSEVC